MLTNILPALHTLYLQGLFTMTKAMGVLPLVHVPVAAYTNYDITYA